MKSIQVASVLSSLSERKLRRPFQFGKVVAERSHYVSTSAVSNGTLGMSGSLTMDPWSLRGRFEESCYEIMPALVLLCQETVTRLIKQDLLASTPPAFWDQFFAECYSAAKAKWGQDFPKLAVSVALAPIEFAIWDLYGRIHNLPWAKCLSSDFLGDEDFTAVVGERPADHVEILHTIGGKDCLIDLLAEGIVALKDGLPETVLQEIRNGRYKWLKPKVTGNFDYDVRRVAQIDSIVAKLQQEGLIGHVGYFFDANGACPDISWLSRFLEQIHQSAHGADRTITNFEQPFSTENTFKHEFNVHSLSGYCDLSIDESLIEVGDVARAKAQGYKNLGVKVCKSVTETLRILLEAQRLGLNCDMQDLTQIGYGLAVSAGMSAWCGLRIESNGGKNIVNSTDAFGAHLDSYRGLTKVNDGTFFTGNLTGYGFSAA